MKTLMCLALFACVFMAYASAFPGAPVAVEDTPVQKLDSQGDLVADESAWHGRGYYGRGWGHGGWGHRGYGGWGHGGYAGYYGGWGGRGYGGWRGGYGGWGR